MIQYVDDVLNDRVLTSHKIYLACQRFKRDLERSKSNDFPFYYDQKMADKAIKFIELLPKTDGTKLEMQPFQKWIISELYGWREKSTGYRRYDRAFISMARKSGKTYLASGMAAIGLLMEKVPAQNRQVLFVSNALKQAKLGYDMLSSELRQVRQQSKVMRQRVLVQKQAITDLKTNSKAMALASDTGTLDGYAGTTIILDEWHEAKDRKVYNVLKSGQGNEPNSLLAVISTSGLNLNVPMYDEYKLVTDILNGKTTADRYFIAVWELDDRDEVNNPEMWIKANPLMSEPHVNQRMREKLQSDLDLAVQQDNVIPFLVKNMNMWLQAESDSYINADDWEKATTELSPQDLDGKDVYIGADLSKTNDLTAVSWLVPLDDGTFYCDSHSWVGTKYGLDSKIKRDGIDYRAMQAKGEVSITPLESGVIDYDDVFRYVEDLISRYHFNVKYVAYDPYNANALISKLEKQNYPLFEVRQGTQTLNIPTRDFRDDLFAGKIKHADNKVLAYAINNAVIKVTNNGWLIDKTKNSNKIDPVAALIDAYVAGQGHFEKQEANDVLNDYYMSDEFMA